MLIPIQYHKKQYPSHIKTNIDEIAGHFDKINISPIRDFCLHTEYSYGCRKLDSVLINKFPTLQNAHKKYIPQLWYSENWAIEFASFIKTLCSDHKPSVIEVHPPFSDYIESIDKFINIYKIFEHLILGYYPDTKILIENRCGSTYRNGKFILSNGEQLENICSSIHKNNLNLRITLDIPQLFSFYGGPIGLKATVIRDILDSLLNLRPMIKGIHLWGKKKNNKGRIVSHSGDLNTYFESIEKKEIFLEWMVRFLKDKKPRYFVPEVNSTNEDLGSIINDLENAGIIFCNFQ